MNLILLAIWWMLPAYFANGMPIVLGGRTPLDFGKKLKNHRIFGDGKTIRGTFLGIFIGSFIGYLTGRLEIGILLALGAILGDLLGSFVKRRLNRDRGHRFWVLDQFDFVVGALLLAAILEIPDTNLLIAILVITPLLHILTNYIAHWAGFKDVWW